jgi:hypothetical protein
MDFFLLCIQNDFDSYQRAGYCGRVRTGQIASLIKRVSILVLVDGALEEEMYGKREKSGKIVTLKGEMKKRGLDRLSPFINAGSLVDVHDKKRTVIVFERVKDPVIPHAGPENSLFAKDFLNSSGVRVPGKGPDFPGNSFRDLPVCTL